MQHADRSSGAAVDGKIRNHETTPCTIAACPYFLRENAAMKLYLLAILSSAMTLLTGCMGGVILPAPHTTRATPEIRARLTDATTGQPVSGGIVRIPERPKTFAVSSEDGTVALKPVRTFHWFLAGSQHDWDSLPVGYEWSGTLEVVHPDYETRRFKAPMVTGDPMLIGDVQLTRKSR